MSYLGIDEFSVDGYNFHYIENDNLIHPIDCPSELTTPTTPPINENCNGQQTNPKGSSPETNDINTVDHKKTRHIKCVEGCSLAGYWDYQFKLPDQCYRELSLDFRIV